MIGKIIILYLILTWGRTSFPIDEKKFCSFLTSNQLDGCQMQLDNYFNQTDHNYKDKCIKLDTLIKGLNNFDCIDTCFIANGIMKTKPPMADLYIYKMEHQDTLKYVIRVLFKTPMKVVWMKKSEY